MNLKTMRTFLQISFGMMLGVFGMPLTTYQYWVLGLMFLAYGEVTARVK